MKEWHKNAIVAVVQLGNKHYEVMSPGSFHFWYGSRYIFEYKPDVVWLYREERVIKAVVWEMESEWPDTKRICGDAVLASMVIPDNTYCFLSKGRRFARYGETIRSAERSDWTGRVIGDPGDCRLSPKLGAFFLVLEGRGTKMSIQPYLNAIKSKTRLFRGKPANAIHLPSHLDVTSMKDQLRFNDAVRNWI